MSGLAGLGVVAILIAYLLFVRVERHGPQTWLGVLMCAGLVGAVLYQIYLRS